MTDKPRVVVEVAQTKGPNGSVVCANACPQYDMQESECCMEWAECRAPNYTTHPGPLCPGPSKGKGYALVDVDRLDELEAALRAIANECARLEGIQGVGLTTYGVGLIKQTATEALEKL